jgi:hypothetical protein
MTLNFWERAQSLVTTQLTAHRKMSSLANNSSVEFFSSENKFDTADILVKRCLFTIYSVASYLTIFQIILLMIIITLGILTIVLSCIFLANAKASLLECRRILIQETKEFHKQLKKDQEEFEKKQEEEALDNAFELRERMNNYNKKKPRNN